MGCTIEGERLGLGTNLFSGLPTLAESMGFNSFNSQVSGNSEYYSRVFRREVPAQEGVE
jgi:phosphoglycerol transferase